MKIEELVYWITEREQMRRHKEVAERMGAGHGLKYGWSDDPIMGTTRWCNVRREDDKVTRWMRENWSTAASPVWWFTLGRMLNYIPTLSDILDYGVDGERRAPDDLPTLEGLADGLKACRAVGNKVFTSAYTISTCGQKMDKIDYVIGVVGEVKRLEEDGLIGFAGPLPTLKASFDQLTQVNGLGSFLAAQVIADLKNTAGHPLQTASDWQTWAAPGPGSLRGLAAFYGATTPVRAFTPAINDCWSHVRPKLPPELQNMHMQDFQNCLCEFSKYMKLKEGRGHARNKYTAG